MESQPPEALEVFYSYSHKDEELRDELDTHLAMLKREGVIQGWHDRRIIAGQEWDGEIDTHLKTAHIILLLVSSDFLASSYCYDIEVEQAMERHEAGETRIIPIILRPCDWKSAPFGKLQALPKDALPVKKWADRDEAFLNIAEGIRRAAEHFTAKRAEQTIPIAEETQPSPASYIPPPPVTEFVPRQDRERRYIVDHLKKELTQPAKRVITLWGQEV